MYWRCVVVLCCLSPARTRGLGTVPQYARDVSEHCKRRDSLPSVFLSRRVMGAEVLHFFKLDTPYSCFATVRTESGHSILMVLEILSDEYQQAICEDGHQVQVYDFPETFGGYWGPIPDMIFEDDPDRISVYTKQYTLETRPPDTTTTEVETTHEDDHSETHKQTDIGTAETQSFIRMDMPLVNLSADPVPGDKVDSKPFDQDEFFDLFYDVLPRAKQPYDSSIVPLVEIVVNTEPSRRVGDGDDNSTAAGVDDEPRYQLEYELEFTPDSRLTMPAWSTHVNTNRNANRWKKKKLKEHVRPKTNHSPHTKEPGNPRKLKHYSLPTTSNLPLYEHMLPQTITKNQYEKHQETYKEPYNLIDDIMKSLNESGDLIQGLSTNSDVLVTFNESENIHNLSVFLAPYPTYTFLPVRDVPINITKNIPDINLRRNTEITFRASSTGGREYYTTDDTYLTEGKPQEDFEIEKDITTLANVEETVKLTIIHTQNEIMASEININKEKIRNQEEHSNTSSSISSSFVTEATTDDVLASKITTESLSGTLVDHESWENVVQSAPVMAGLLNQHVPERDSPPINPSDNSSTAQKHHRSRRKRRISAIAVEAARPHRRQVSRSTTTQPTVYNAEDLHELARLMELPDDQMNNHVLIEMNKNSTQLFNMCDTSYERKSRFLVLFNSSRILFQISNFSMPHIMVALTTARVLAPTEQQCPRNLVECQVEGTRLCIDSTNACDGVPNCGTACRPGYYQVVNWVQNLVRGDCHFSPDLRQTRNILLDAYDEDRVLCGAIDQRRNVYLAAVTCLAVLITMLYVIHYWLQRCVPKVAEAFFVYTDSADNELYLDSIMRSPTDVGYITDEDRYVYNSALFDDANMLYPQDMPKSGNIFKRMFSVFSNVRLIKQRKKSRASIDDQTVRQSFAGQPLNKCSVSDMGLQKMTSVPKIDQEVQTGESVEMAYLKAINSFKKDAPENKSFPPPQSMREVALRDFFGGPRTSSMDTSVDSPGPSGRSVSAYVASLDEEQEINTTFFEPGTGNIVKSLKSPGSRAAQGRKLLRFSERATFIPREDDDNEEVTESAPVSTRRPSGFISPGKTSRRLRPKPDDNVADHGSSDFRNFFRKKKDHK